MWVRVPRVGEIEAGSDGYLIPILGRLLTYIHGTDARAASRQGRAWLSTGKGREGKAETRARRASERANQGSPLS